MQEAMLCERAKGTEKRDALIVLNAIKQSLVNLPAQSSALMQLRSPAPATQPARSRACISSSPQREEEKLEAEGANNKE